MELSKLKQFQIGARVECSAIVNVNKYRRLSNGRRIRELDRKEQIFNGVFCGVARVMLGEIEHVGWEEGYAFYTTGAKFVALVKPDNSVVWHKPKMVLLDDILIERSKK